MVTTPLDLNSKPFFNTDAIANSIAANDLFDCYLEPVPGVGLVTRRRPGLKLFADLGTGAAGDGLFNWDAMGKVIAVSGGRIFELSSDGTYTDKTGAPLKVGVPVTFADGQDTGGNPWLYMANGNLVYSTGGDTAAPLAPQVRTTVADASGLAVEATGASWTLSANHYTNPAVAVQIAFVYSGAVDYSAVSVTVTGTDINNAALVEVLQLPEVGGTAVTAGYFKTVVTVVPSDSIVVDADPAGFCSASTGNPLPLANREMPFNQPHKITILNNTSTDLSALGALVIGLDDKGVYQTEDIVMPAGNAMVTTKLLYTYLQTIEMHFGQSIGAATLSIGWASNGVNIGWGTSGQEIGTDNVPASTHVTFVKGSFLGNEPGTNRFDFTDTNPTTGLLDNAYWSSVDNPLTCDAKGDKLSALFSAWQEVYCWGSDGLEIWQNDGVTPFTPIPGAFAEGGIEAPYSVVVADNTVFALCVIADSRVVIKLQGRAPVVVSEAIGRVLADMPDVSDAIGDVISVGGIAVYLLNFPTANQTWAYDYKNDVWSQWGYWDITAGEHNRFIGQHSAFVKAWNKHLIMSRADGKIYELDRATFDDDGNEMVSFRRTGWINHGTYNRKVCDQFYVKCKAGMSDIGTLLLRWRDEGNEEWGQYVEVPLNPVGRRDFLAKMNRMGMYRSRQYEFRLSDTTDLVLVGVDTELRALSS